MCHEIGKPQYSYENESLKGIASSRSLSFHKTIVETNVIVQQSIHFIASSAKSLDAKGCIDAICSIISDVIVAVGLIKAIKCAILGELHAGGSIEVSDCPSIKSLQAGHRVKITNSTIEGNVYCNYTPMIVNSQIKGKLVCSSNELTIENSRIETIYLRCLDSKATQTVKLINSHVTNIFFENKGELFLRNRSSIKMVNGANYP